MDKEPRVLEKAKELEAHLDELGIRVKLDSSDHTPGWKFAEWEMKGVPLRLEIGPRDLDNGTLSLSKRFNGEKEIISIADLDKIPAILKEIQDKMYEKAMKYLQEHITTVNSLDELKGSFAYEEFSEIINKLFAKY